MFFRIPWLAILLFVVAATAVELPKDEFAPGWRRSEAALVFQKQDLYGYINGGAELYLEYGFAELVVQRYHHGQSELSLDIYRMVHAEAALAIYLAKKGVEQPLAGVSARNTGGIYQITALQGPYFIQVNNLSGEAEHLPVMVQLLEKFLENVEEETAVLRLEEFPENRIPGSELLIGGPYSLQMVYTLGDGDILQLAGRPYALCARVADSTGKRQTWLRAAYADSVEARAVLRELSDNLDEYLEKISTADDSLTFKDYKNEYGRIVRRGAVLEVNLHLRQL